MDHQLAQARSNPFRARILAALADCNATKRQLAKALGENLSKVSYHTKVLLTTDCIQPVEDEPVGEDREPLYELTSRGASERSS